MSKALILALAVLTVAVAANVNQHLSTVGRVRGADPEWSRFVSFVHKYKRDYNSVRVVNAKFDIFRDNMRTAAEHQRRNPLARFGPTIFSDIPFEEFRRTHLMSINNTEWAAAHAALPKFVPKHSHKHVHNTPNDVDWCAKGACSPIKDQGQCGSCWAFSATEVFESAIFLSKGALPGALGPQQIVDCDSSDNACQGGIPSSALSYLATAGGQEDENDYPYTSGQSGQAGSCSFDKSKADPSTGTIQGSSSVSSGDEGDLTKFIQTQGPPSVAVDASSWNSYQGGVLTDCGTNLDHAVQATGLGNQGGQNVIIVRNSWGTGWGENGFIFLLAGQNTCGIANQACWATV